MKKKIGLLLFLLMTIYLAACGNEKTEFEPVTVAGFTVSSSVQQVVEQGIYDFDKNQLVDFLPDLHWEIPQQDFTFHLELIHVELEEAESTEPNEAVIPNPIVVNTEGTVTFEPITFHYAGIYTFRIYQSQSGIQVNPNQNWQIDGSAFYLDVIVTEDQENEVLRASVSWLEEAEFFNEHTLYVEEILTTLFNSIAFRMDSEHALLINLSTGEILFEHQADVRAFPASVTKIMTVLIGLEQVEMEETITVSADFDRLFLAEASQSGFVDGETREFSEILHGIMLGSGGEATESLANHVAGSYEGFVELMNLKAAQLNMNDTHFVTATGLHDDNHYTTAHDIAILLRYALENPEFRAIFTTESYELETPNAITDVLHSTLFRAAPTTEFNGGQIIGGRTGFTTPAGRCLASLATNGTDEFILITFGARYDDPAAHVLDALLIYEYFLHEKSN